MFDIQRAAQNPTQQIITIAAHLIRPTHIFIDLAQKPE
jgi:hypothetical protein